MPIDQKKAIYCPSIHCYALVSPDMESLRGCGLERTLRLVSLFITFYQDLLIFHLKNLVKIHFQRDF